MVSKSRGIAASIEEKFGLPNLKEISDTLSKLSALMEGGKGKRLERVIANLKDLASDRESAQNAITLLSLVERLDQEGTLARFDQLLRDLKPVVNAPLTKDLVQRIGQLGDVLELVQQLTGGET